MSAKEEIILAFEKGVISEVAKDRLLEYNARLTSNNVPIIYNLRHLRKLLQIKRREQNHFFGKDREQSYKKFYIKKKSGGQREIEAPIKELKVIQVWIKENILDKFEVSQFAKGFKKCTSIYDNAMPHVNKELVINLDLKDFFPTIKYSDVYKVFNYIGYTQEVCHLLTQLCTNGNGVLPQGAPTSPVLSNLICLKLDKRLSKLAEKCYCDYTRYADDITFSGAKTIKSVLPLIAKIIQEEGFCLNDDKTRLQYSFQRQEVTGLIVNKKVTISKRLQKELEDAIYYCSKFSVESHMTKIDCKKSFYKEHLYGIAYFVKMINVKQGEKYLQELDKIDWPY